jgi:hypothetical protein
MSLSIAATVVVSLLALSAGGTVAGLLEHNRQERQRWAAQTWRDVTLRNGVTARSPFHSDKSSFNAPGLVRAYPRSQRPAPPVSVPTDEQVHSARQRLPSALHEVCNNPVRTELTPFEELPELPIELLNPPHPYEGELCRQSYLKGDSQTKLIKAVWGISKGGGYKYTEARRRFRAHVADIATGDLQASIQADMVNNHA